MVDFSENPKVREIISTYDVTAQVEALLKKKGINLVAKPVFTKVDGIDLNEDMEPMIPEDLTILSSKQIGIIYSMCNSYFSYITSQLTLADLEMSICESLKDALWAAVRLEDVSEKKTKADKDDRVLTDSRFMRADADYKIRKSVYDMLKGKHDSFEMNLKVISREITRRSQDAFSGNSRKF